MEEILQIGQACKDGNHELIKRLLDSIDSEDFKKQAFIKVINYYENEESLFPAGYLLFFIRWLLQHNDYAAAMEYILKCRRAGVAEDRISQLIFKTVIEPNEALYKENFNQNLNLLQRNKMLISGQVFDFEQIKKKVLMIANCCPPVPDKVKKGLFNKDKIFLMVDIADMEMLPEAVKALNYVYLVYEDIQILYYLLLFEDLSGLSEYIEQKKIVFFDGMDERSLKDFFLNLAVIVPKTVFGRTNIDKYDGIINEILSMRVDKIFSIVKAIDAYYKNLDHQYYRDLLKKEPSKIKVLLITSEFSEINKFITRNWHEAFLELGYKAELMFEERPFEKINYFSISQAIHEFKPDVIFMINWTVSAFIEKGETCKNILWIIRHRDTSYELHRAKPGYEYNNMFLLPILFEWKEKMKNIGIPENRIFTTSDGVNTGVFRKNNKIDRCYACDIVSVNNAAGSESLRLDFYLKDIKNELFKKIIFELIDMLKKAFNDEKTVFILPDTKSLIEILKEKLLFYDIPLCEDLKKYIENLFMHIMDSLCRGKIMEWIIDSRITTNIKLWGKGWSNNEKFKEFHMSIARHGEQLSSIYQGAKISISDNPWAVHERNFEVFASGGFPLIRYVKWPEIENPNKITNHFKENEEVVMFYSKDDLLNKIQYYLDNPEERERIAENGRRVVINNFSHTAIARKTMDFIKDYYKE